MEVQELGNKQFPASTKHGTIKKNINKKIKLSSSKVPTTCAFPTLFLVLLSILGRLFKNGDDSKSGWMSIIVTKEIWSVSTRLSEITQLN